MIISPEDKETLEHELVIKLDPCLRPTETDVQLILKILSRCECKAKRRDTLFKMRKVCLRLLNQQ